VVRDAGVKDGLCTIFIRHTSASLTIQENADPSAKRDLEAWLNRLVPESDPLYTHNGRGAGRHAGAYQGDPHLHVAFHPDHGWPARARHVAGHLPVEHRRSRHERRVVVHIGQ
jgi:thiamine phosphate synthase YjbQ (UPF0047 family)